MVNEFEVTLTQATATQEFFPLSFRSSNTLVRSNSGASMLWLEDCFPETDNKMPRQQSSNHSESLYGILRNNKKQNDSSSSSSPASVESYAPAAGVASAVRDTATVVAFPEATNSSNTLASSSSLHDSGDFSLAEMLELSQELEDDPLKNMAKAMEPTRVAESPNKTEQTQVYQNTDTVTSHREPTDWLAMMGSQQAPDDLPPAADLVFAVEADSDEDKKQAAVTNFASARNDRSLAATVTSNSCFSNQGVEVASSSREPAQRRSSNTSSITGSRPFQTCQWNEKFKELCLYKQKYGHAQVPLNPEKPQFLALARWVKRQRYQYKLYQEGQPSSMTLERLQDLESVGFVWDSQGANWLERLQELKDYRGEYGDCNVPTNYRPNRPLATWVKCQRRQYKLFARGESSNITRERIQELDNLGFEWTLRSEYGKRK